MRHILLSVLSFPTVEVDIKVDQVTHMKPFCLALPATRSSFNSATIKFLVSSITLLIVFVDC